MAKMPAVAALMLMGVIAHADSITYPITLSASTSPSGPADYTKHETIATMSWQFILTITGGTGSGLYAPDLSMFGETNESNGVYELLGAYASFEWSTDTGEHYSQTAGSPYGGPANLNPNYSCVGDIFCRFDFVYDVPQLVTFTASVDAIVELSPLFPNSGGSFGMGSVTLNPVFKPGIFGIFQSTLVDAPEPATTQLMAFGLVAGLAILRRLRASER
jgi:hypothetical protein